MDRLIKEIKGTLGALFIAVIIRTFLFQPFVIPSASMYPTLMIGDFLFVTKYTYGYSNYSFPFAPPLFQGRLMENDKPTLGQVAVFRAPVGKTENIFLRMTIYFDESLDYIKRVVGLPGDKVQVKNGILHINGVACKLEKLEDYTLRDPRYNSVKVYSRYRETLPNGKTHEILMDLPFGAGPVDNTPEYTVPEGHYFVMGDNRHHSQDSRYMKELGFIPEDHLLGPARILFFSTEARWYDVLAWIPGIRVNRILKVIE
ncbi:signal peptidase I [Candidatus Odyssella thessalonicensis]|uniref:signal peptidase I n=1 Tax=Candidatus Odyssella thessalonicensis TaxID=84647 RepID=UPI000225B206|nr:signal peptidase I [Candidatus Odyssella thessalonicensis]